MHDLYTSSFRLVCTESPAVAPPCQCYAAKPPVPYSLEQKSFQRRLREAAAPHTTEIHQLASRHVSCFSDLQLMQIDSGQLSNLLLAFYWLKVMLYSNDWIEERWANFGTGGTRGSGTDGRSVLSEPLLFYGIWKKKKCQQQNICI